MNLDNEYRLSLYEELKLIHKSRKVKAFLVQNLDDDKIYIKKEIKEYSKEIYENIKNIDSKNTPKIYEIFEMEEKLVIIEEFINGDTLQSILEKEKKLEEKRVIEYMISLCDILEEIHSLNPPIIHRDIKPSNIIISNDNVLKLIDFDIARAYKEGKNLDTTILGTKGYASPEQFGFEQSDCRSDIYAMGVMMNVLTTGKHIKEEENNTLLKDIIKKCTNISKEERYNNVCELREELKFILEDVTSINRRKNKNKSIYKNKYYKDKGNFKSINKKDLVLPGFRRNYAPAMIIASIVYLLVFSFCFVASSTKEFLENLVLIWMILSISFIFTNYLNLRDKLPIAKDDNLLVRTVGCFIYSFGIVIVSEFLLNLL